jgi:hypothetical protein
VDNASAGQERYLHRWQEPAHASGRLGRISRCRPSRGRGRHVAERLSDLLRDAGASPDLPQVKRRGPSYASDVHTLLTSV